jgi:5-methylthioadenosine/S-adenosylhomocysteine deaminase
MVVTAIFDHRDAVGAGKPHWWRTAVIADERQLLLDLPLAPLVRAQDGVAPKMTATRQLLRNAHVLTQGTSFHLPRTSDVLIEDGVIQQVAPNIPDAAEAVTVDLTGHLLLPGFVNAHYHSHDVLAKGTFDSVPLEQWGVIAGAIGADRTLEEVRLRTLVGALECLHNGITTVQDFANVAPMDERYVDAILDAYSDAGIRVIFSIAMRDRPQIETIPWLHEHLAPELHDIVGTRHGDAQAQLSFVERQIDRIGDRGGMVVWALSPSAPHRCSPELLAGIGELSRRRGVPVYTHVYETRAQRLYAQETFPEHAGSLLGYMAEADLLGPHVWLAHGVWPDTAEIKRIADTGTGVVVNMLSNLRLGSGVAPLTEYRRLGVPLALGCDNCSCSDVQSMLQVMKLYCLLGGIMDPDADRPTAAEALELATAGGARSAGQSHAFGQIAIGMRADLITLDLSDPAYRPLNDAVRQVVYSESGRALRDVWVDGEHVIADGRSIRVDEEELARALEEMMTVVRGDLVRFRRDSEKVLPALEKVHRRAWSEPLGYNRYIGCFRGCPHR